MSEMAPGAAKNGTREGRAPAATSSYITGCIYQLVQMTGRDGKKLLKLFPISKPLNNLEPLVQSPIMSHAVNGNVLPSIHDNGKTLFTNTTTSPAAKISGLKSITPGQLILPKPLNQLEKTNVVSVVSQQKNPTTSTVFDIQNSCSADRSSIQKVVAPVCSETSTTDTAFVRTENTVLPVKSPMLLSGHHLHIPAHATVKSLPASFLPPVILQKILITDAAPDTSGTGEVTDVPTVIFVSPVNTVKMPASESLQTICPKPVAGITNSLIQTAPQKAVSSSAIKASTSDSMEKKTSPIKWAVHEKPRSSASCLVPVKSSNNIASKLLKVLADTKDTQSNSTSILPTCSSSLNESNEKITPLKDNALIMYNGKLYLLAKKDTNILSTSGHIKQEITNVRKQTSELISSATDSTITDQVINLVLSKNKGIASNVKEPKFSDSMIPYPESEINKGFKAELTPASPHDILQISSTRQHEAVSSWGNVSVGINIAQQYATKENTYGITQNDLSYKAATDASLSIVVHHAVEEQQVDITTSGMPIWMNHSQKQQKKQYLQLRKKFGLFKEEKVYLRRIVLPDTSKSSEGSVFSSSVQINDIDNLMPLPIESKSGKEERIIGEQGKKLSIKRMTEAIPVLENSKKRKTDVTIVLNSKLECNSSYSVTKNLSNSCIQDLPEQEHSTSFRQCSHNVTNSCVHSNEENSVLNPASYCHKNETALNEVSFKKDIFPFSPPDLEETIKDEKITRLKLLLKEQEAALETIRKKMHQP